MLPHCSRCPLSLLPHTYTLPAPSPSVLCCPHSHCAWQGWVSRGLTPLPPLLNLSCILPPPLQLPATHCCSVRLTHLCCLEVCPNVCQVLVPAASIYHQVDLIGSHLQTHTYRHTHKNRQAGTHTGTHTGGQGTGHTERSGVTQRDTHTHTVSRICCHPCLALPYVSTHRLRRRHAHSHPHPTPHTHTHAIPPTHTHKTRHRQRHAVTLVMTVSSMMPPLSLVNTDREPVPSARPAMSPVTSPSRKGTASLPCAPGGEGGGSSTAPQQHTAQHE